MLVFYKNHLDFITERSIDPDRRAHVIEGEAARHFLDADHFGSYPFTEIPRKREKAIVRYSLDTLEKYGMLPWAIYDHYQLLVKAFETMDAKRILLYSAYLGHYVADACTPLHTSLYYNGRTYMSQGIHALWETRLPELYASTYSYITGKPEPIDCALEKAWELILESHLKVDTIYMVFYNLVDSLTADRIYSHEMRGQALQRVFSADFSGVFHANLEGMVERQMRRAVNAISGYWYAAWHEAGEPDLKPLVSGSLHRRLQRFMRSEERAMKQNGSQSGFQRYR